MSVEAQSIRETLAARYNLPEQPEWQQFLNHFDLSENFALVVLLVMDADGADLCRVELEKQLRQEGKKLISLDVPSPDGLRNLPSQLMATQLSADTGGLWIAGVEPDYSQNFLAWKDAWQFALARLNPRRNEIRRQFNCSLIFVGAPWLQETMREIAPDIWSVRTLVARIEPMAVSETRATISEKPSLDSGETEGGSDPIFALQEADKLRAVPGKELALANLLHRAGEGFANLHDWRLADKAFSESLELKNNYNAPDSSLLGTLAKLGTARLAIGQNQNAIVFYKQALQIARKIGNRRNEAAILGNLGNAYLELGDAQKAIEFSNEHLMIAREIGNRALEGNALGNLGSAYQSLSDERKAIEFYEQRLAIARETGDRRAECTAIGNLGLCYSLLGNLHKAIEFYEQALVIAREIGDRQFENSVLGNLGIAYRSLGDTNKAIDFLEQALRIAREIGYRSGEGADLGNLGISYAGLGDERKAIEYFEQSLKLHREIGARHREGNDLGNLGSSYLELGDTRKAIEFYEQALVIAREIGDRRLEANALFNSALAFNKLGNQIQAIDRAEAALQIYKAIEAPYATKVLQQLAEWRGRK